MNATRSLANNKKRSTAIVATVFLIPVFFFITVFIIYPIADSFWLSLHQWNGISSDRNFIGLENWKVLITDNVFYKAFFNNIIIVILSIIVQLPIAMAIAFLLDTGGKRLNILKMVYFLPMLMSSVAVGFLFRYAYDPQFGIISAIDTMLGGEGMIDLLGNTTYAIYAVIAVICWQFIPFYMVYFLAGLSSIPVELYEAAIIDGATRGQYFWKIALPSMKGTIKSAVVLSLVGSLKYFDLIYVMTQGGPNGATELMATYMYKNAFQTMKMGYGSTIAFAMFVVITTIALVTLKAINGKEEA
ncbi:multiple sugar transport system permease protein/raffinose/stachyose/melibiose transport system permease protein [Ruminiclostridium sufflavum DSM 19573]|uniref:Multiple sugar transport system permease protein/raffinose/stachyose/melibiose transport system permease protein n=1 Tax=Ruminiclostridium sufflavum DSM 19573 TaxID=1121337 RepID=A0A318XK30_9FIRM|nr:sugar ABC transporter permease [Ruminiclostridium sufflavum]PYG87756.1 multiple sugar transport system permease protein/raffinose/stachyose/melibiose transport system permease protein [Ruminiclostridium sufflavum DSM 19573]